MNLRDSIDVLIAALPRETRRLTKGWRHQRFTVLGREIRLAWSGFAVVASVGMGQDNAARALHAVAALTGIRTVASVGYAGSLDPSIRPGALIRPSVVIDAQTGERYRLVGGDGSVAVTTRTFADAEEKRRLAATYSAQMVEMEAAGLARACLQMGVPFQAFKAISDDASFSMPALRRFTTPDGGFRTAGFASHVLLRPHLWNGARRMGAGAAKADAVLTSALQAWLARRAR